MKTVVIIVTYNGMRWLDRCISSVPLQYPVVVIDNNSSDGTKDFLKGHSRAMHLLFQEYNLGFGQANNLGMSYALNTGATAVFLLNQDAYLFDQTISILEAASQSNGNYGVLSPVHVDASQITMDRNFSYYMSYDQNTSFYSDCFFDRLKSVYEVPFVNAAGWYIPKTTLETVGGFDPLFFHYGEDDNYCQRLRFHKLKVGVVAKSLMIHDRLSRSHVFVRPFSENAFKIELRKIKLFVSNPNKNDADLQLEKKIKQYRVRNIKNLIILRKEAFYYYNRILKTLIKEKNAILASYTQNKTVGKHYL